MITSSTSPWTRRAALRHLLLALAVGSIGCSTFSIKADSCPAYPTSRPAASATAPPPDEVKIQYLGVGGYLIRRGDDVVLLGPQYSNPGLAEVAFDHQARTDRALVDGLLPAEASLASAIVIGHSHYDHLLDTPYIATTHSTGAKVYGSRTMANMIGSAVEPARLVDVGPEADAHQPVQISSRVRLWPIRSEHSDQFRMKIPLSGINVPVHMWRGEVAEPLSELPKNISEWAEGEVFAYVLDFMDATGTNVEFRVFYQDSGTNRPVGLPASDVLPLLDGKGVDVALICVGGDFERLTDHPGGVIKATRPRFLLLGHWENFFEPQTDICRTGIVDAIPLSDPKEFMGEAAEAMSEAGLQGRPILPCPTASVFYFPVDDSNDAAVHKALKKGRVSYNCGEGCTP